MRIKFGGCAAALAIVVLGVLAFGSSAAAADGKGKKTLKLIGRESQSEFLDLGTPGPSLGDQLVFSEVLFRRGRGEVGMSGVVCTVTEALPPYDVLTFHCVATLSLRRGQITLQGLVEAQGMDDPGPFRVAITGGTGAFRAAGGEARVRFPRPMRSVYKLRFDSKDKEKHKKKRRRN
jgi:allene oxide cyclase-like protein